MRVFTHADTPSPEVHLLSNGRYHVMVTNAGGGYSRWRDLAVTRWREDATLRRAGAPSATCATSTTGDVLVDRAPADAGTRADSYEAIFSEGRAEFRRRDDGIETHTEIAVSPEDDIELRRVRITNRGRTRAHASSSPATPRWCWRRAAADAAHPAFSNLFVQTEIARASRQAILCTRRPRSADEQPPWMFHLMTVHGAAVERGVATRPTARASSAAAAALAAPAALRGAAPLSGQRRARCSTRSRRSAHA